MHLIDYAASQMPENMTRVPCLERSLQRVRVVLSLSSVRLKSSYSNFTVEHVQDLSRVELYAGVGSVQRSFNERGERATLAGQSGFCRVWGLGFRV